MSRETVACARCALVLYAGRVKCPRCGASFVAPAPAAVMQDTAIEPVRLVPWPPDADNVAWGAKLNIGGAIRACREALGLSQQGLIERINRQGRCTDRRNRTWLSKLENRRTVPSLRSVEKLCKAFGLPVPFFLALCEVPGI